MIELDSATSNQIPGENLKNSGIRMKLLGIGGAGCGILSRLNSSLLPSIEFIALNTDKSSLGKCRIKKRLQLGESITRGWGTGGDPKIGRQVALQEKDRLKEILKGTDLFFILVGLGKGTGTGISPVIAQLAKEMDILTWGIVILPFFFEGKRRIDQAREGLNNLEKTIDALMIIHNDSLLENGGENLSLKEGFRKIDKFLEKIIFRVGNFFLCQGFIEVDFADVKSLLRKGNRIQVFTGKGKGEEASREAVKEAFSFSLYKENFLKRAEGVIINVQGGKDLSLSEVKNTVHLVKSNLSSKVDIIFGAGVDENLTGEIILTLIIAGKEDLKPNQEGLNLGIFHSDDLEIPTFLRKGGN